MGRRLKRINWWIRRRSHLPVILLGAGVVCLLVFNEQTSHKKTKELRGQIATLKQEIKEANDSADYYTAAREQLLTDAESLEHVARERYGFQQPTEDVYIIR